MCNNNIFDLSDHRGGVLFPAVFGARGGGGGGATLVGGGRYFVVVGGGGDDERHRTHPHATDPARFPLLRAAHHRPRILPRRAAEGEVRVARPHDVRGQGHRRDTVLQGAGD